MSLPMITLGTAHPVKFPEAIIKADVNVEPALPAHLKDLFERDERFTVLANELSAVQSFVAQHGNRGKPL
jgi:threonine synthase